MTEPAVPARRSSSVVVAAIVASAVVVLALVAALVGLYALSTPDQRPDLKPLFTALAAGVPTVVGALVVLANSKRQHAETAGKLATITSQTNGVLSERIQQGVAAALAQRDAAVAASVPHQRATDPVHVPTLPGAHAAPEPSPLPSTP